MRFSTPRTALTVLDLSITAAVIAYSVYIMVMGIEYLHFDGRLLFAGLIYRLFITLWALVMDPSKLIY